LLGVFVSGLVSGHVEHSTRTVGPLCSCQLSLL
jgi:hypothetical protein